MLDRVYALFIPCVVISKCSTESSDSGAVNGRGLNTAMVGLQGGGPLISLEFEVLNPSGEYSPAHSEPSSSSTSSFDNVGGFYFIPSAL